MSVMICVELTQTCCKHVSPTCRTQESNEFCESDTLIAYWHTFSVPRVLWNCNCTHTFWLLLLVISLPFPPASRSQLPRPYVVNQKIGQYTVYTKYPFLCYKLENKTKILLSAWVHSLIVLTMVTFQHIDTDLLSLSADLECVDGTTVLGKLDRTRE